MAGHTFQVPRLHGADVGGSIPMVRRKADLSWFIATTTDITQNWTLKVTNGVPYRFIWGDGAVTDTVGNGANQAIAHNYGGAGTYRIRLQIQTKADLLLLYSINNSLTGQLPNMSRCTGLQYFYANSNPGIYGRIPALSNCPALISFRIQTDGVSGNIPSLTGCVALASLYLDGCALLTGYTASTIAASCTVFSATGAALSLAAVDQILTDFTTGAGGRPGAGTIDLSGGTSAVPTAAVKAACVAALPGWTITTN